MGRLDSAASGDSTNSSSASVSSSASSTSVSSSSVSSTDSSGSSDVDSSVAGDSYEFAISSDGSPSSDESVSSSDSSSDDSNGSLSEGNSESSSSDLSLVVLDDVLLEVNNGLNVVTVLLTKSDSLLQVSSVSGDGSLLSSEDSSVLSDSSDQSLSNGSILLSLKSSLVELDGVSSSSHGEEDGVDDRVDSVSQLDWVTGDSGLSSDDGEGVLSDHSTLVDDGEDSSSVVLDVSELSVHDSLVSSDHLNEDSSSLSGSVLESLSVSLDLLDDEVDDLLSGIDDGLSLGLDSLIVTGLLDWLSLRASSDDVEDSNSVISDVSLLSVDKSDQSSDLNLDDSSSLWIGHSSQVSSVVSELSSNSSEDRSSSSDDSSGSTGDVLGAESLVLVLNSSSDDRSPDSGLSSSVKLHARSDNSDGSSHSSKLNSDDSSPSSDDSQRSS